MIGDGGNEIGLGALPWEDLVAALAGRPAGPIICRVPCDHTLLAGVSNWGGYALAAAVCRLRDRRDLLTPWTASDLRQLINALVKKGGAVDGVTRLPQPTIDGLPWATYAKTFQAIRDLLR